MDPNQPAPAPVSPGPPPTNLGPTTAVPEAYAGMKPNRKPLIFTILGVLLLLGVSGGAIAYVKTRPSAVVAPTPTPAVVTEDVKQALPGIDSSLREADVNISTITASLNDTQGNLSE